MAGDTSGSAGGRLGRAGVVEAAEAARDAAWGRFSVTTLAHLAGAVVHEARNPLHTMAIHLELVRMAVGGLESPLAPRIRKSLEAIEHSIERLDALLETYSTVVRSGRFGGMGENRTCEGGKALGAALEDFRAAAGREGIRPGSLEVELAEDLPRVALSEAEVHLLLHHLGRNGCEAMAGCPGRLRVRAFPVEGGASRGRSLRLEVGDDGPGLSEEARTQAFRLGYSTHPDHPGIGLALVKQIVQSAGGEVTLEAGEGRGTTAVVLLPGVEG